MSLKEMFEAHSRLATTKSPDGMTPDIKRVLMFHVEQFDKKYGDTVNRQTVLAYISGLDAKASTKALFASQLGKFFYWSDFISKEDFDLIKRAFRPVICNWSVQSLTADDVPAFLEQAMIGASALFTGVRNQLMFYLLATIGMRISQLVELSLTSCWLDNGCLRLAIQKKKHDRSQTATSEIKSIPLTHSIGKYNIANLHERYLRMRASKTGDAFFVNQKGGRITDTYMRQITSKIGRKLGLSVSPHTFRHFVGTTVTNKHGIVKAAILLGHSDVRITQRYINPALIDVSDSLPWS